MLDVTSNLSKQVRTTCAEVAERATSVRIEDEAIASYADALGNGTSEPLALDAAHHYLDHGADTVTFILTLDAINFGSGYFPHLEKVDGLSGYFTVAKHLTQYFRQHGSVSADQLASLTADDCARIFEQSTDDPDRAELMRLFAESLNELGDFVGANYAGSFSGLVEDAHRSATRLVELLVAMPSLNDVADYRGSNVAFLKRAQITVSDLNIAFAGEQWGAFTNLSELTVFADNVLPHVLRTDGVLSYAPQLSASIDRGEELQAGSDEEIEIRACTVSACERIADVIRQADAAFTARDLDYMLWNRGRLPVYKSLPRHRCKTRYY